MKTWLILSCAFVQFGVLTAAELTPLVTPDHAGRWSRLKRSLESQRQFFTNCYYEVKEFAVTGDSERLLAEHRIWLLRNADGDYLRRESALHESDADGGTVQTEYEINHPRLFMAGGFRTADTGKKFGTVGLIETRLGGSTTTPMPYYLPSLKLDPTGRFSLQEYLFEDVPYVQEFKDVTFEELGREGEESFGLSFVAHYEGYSPNRFEIVIVERGGLLALSSFRRTPQLVANGKQAETEIGKTLDYIPGEPFPLFSELSFARGPANRREDLRRYEFDGFRQGDVTATDFSVDIYNIDYRGKAGVSVWQTVFAIGTVVAVVWFFGIAYGWKRDRGADGQSH